MRRALVAVALSAALTLPSSSLTAVVAAPGDLEAVVKDEHGKPVADAVVSLTPPAAATRPRASPAIMDQQNKEFVPLVLPVAVGTSVRFPNRDNIRHHVYSFSSAKRFELPLYSGTPAAPVVFDKPAADALLRQDRGGRQGPHRRRPARGVRGARVAPATARRDREDGDAGDARGRRARAGQLRRGAEARSAADPPPGLRGRAGQLGHAAAARASPIGSFGGLTLLEITR